MPLEDFNVEDLRKMASDREIEGRSSMSKDELIEAIREDIQENDPPAQRLEEDPEPVPPAEEATAHERIDVLERRLAALEAQVNAVDSRTRPSTQPLIRSGLE